MASDIGLSPTHCRVPRLFVKSNPTHPFLDSFKKSWKYPRVTAQRTASTALLKEHGLRVTAPRLAVLSALGGLPGHSDVDTIAGASRQGIGSLSTQAVYDILRALHDAGLIRRIQPSGSPARYETRVGDNHHHVVCRVCGETRDVDCTVGASPCLTPSEAGGFVVDEAEVVFWGRCPDCANNSAKGTE